MMELFLILLLFGRGTKGEVFKIENDLLPLLELCEKRLSKTAKFLVLTCHTPGFTSTVLKSVLGQVMNKRGGKITGGEILLESSRSLPIPHGYYARWTHE